MNDLALIIFWLSWLCMVFVFVTLTVRAGSRARFSEELVAYAVTFPRGTSPAQVADLLAGVSGLVAYRWQRPFSVRAIAWEVTATADGIIHHLLVRQIHAATVLSALRAAVPGARVAEDPSYQPPQVSLACQLGQRGAHRVLAEGATPRVAAALLSSLQPLRDGETIKVQWVLQPAGPSGAIPTATPARRSSNRGLLPQVIERAVSTPPMDQAAVADWKRKHAAPVFIATGRVGVVAASTGRARSLRAQVLASLHTANVPGAHLYRSWWPSRWVASMMHRHLTPLVATPALLNADELVGLLGVPLADVMLPGLVASGTPALAPISEIPSYGRVVARSSFPGVERNLALSLPDSLRHLHVIGPTGAGKSTLLLGLISQDMQAGRGVIVVDPKGDLVADVLDRIPPERTGDVVVLDPADEERPVGLNLLARPDDSPELVVDQVVSIFHDLYKDSWGPRTDDILRAALLTLVGVPRMTLAEVPLLLTDPSFRWPLVGRINDPVALGPFWAWYDALSDGERTNAIGPVMNKLRTFLLRKRLRNIIGQAEPTFDFDRALAERAIVLVPLSKGLLGEEAAALLGSLVVTRLWQAVQKRAGLPSSERPATFAYIDEFQDYLHLPAGIETILAQARGLGLGLTLAHQHLGQLPTSVREAVLANARSRVIFQVAAHDAGVLARELAPHVKATDLQALGRYEVVTTLATGARVAPPATAVTLPPPPVTGVAATARLRSRSYYGADRGQVEAAINARHRGTPDAAPTGRKARR
ncbi:MAG: type IV secretion system DNA-binding domain-containing protein [Kineosporiaceae bacterium]|nr:type IV secretion system DNA-binding domain-containing protein [Kineosporiaceae bacterium]